MVILTAYEVIRPTERVKKYKIKRQQNILAQNVEEAKLYCYDRMQWECVIYERGNTEILLNYYRTNYGKTFEFAHIYSVPVKFIPFKLETELKQELLSDIDEKAKLFHNGKFECKSIDLEIRYHMDLPKNYKIVKSEQITDKTLVINEDDVRRGFYYWEKATDKYYFQIIQNRFANPI